MSAALVPLDAASTLQSLIAENEELKEKTELLKKELKEKDLEMASLKLDAAMREAEVRENGGVDIMLWILWGTPPPIQFFSSFP